MEYHHLGKKIMGFHKGEEISKDGRNEKREKIIRASNLANELFS